MRLRPRSLRARVAVAAALAILLATVLLGTTALVLVSRQLSASLDSALRDGAGEVSRLSASAPALLQAPGALEGRVGSRRLLIEVVDRQGRIVARSGSLGGGVLPVDAALRAVIADGQPRFLDATLGDAPVRVYVAPLAELGGPAAGGAVAVASSQREDRESLRHLRVLMLAAAGLAAAVAAIAALLLVRRALAPLGRLAAAAREIERTGDAARTLPAPGTADELDHLATTLNAMLAALDRAQEAERRFIADASHELRTPLTALRGNAAFVAHHGADAAALADLEEGAARLARLVDDLLTLTREDGAARPDGVVRLDELARSVAAGHAAVVVEADAAVSVAGDRAALERALVNLIVNAETHGPAGGRITVTVGRGDGRAVLAVADDGPGFTAEEATHAFERFWRGSQGPGGTGLGLAIVRATAVRHGGTARIVGSKVEIDLPALTDISDSPATPRGGSAQEGSS
jgi:two-component system OmpR family sensor kinase